MKCPVREEHLLNVLPRLLLLVVFSGGLGVSVVGCGNVSPPSTPVSTALPTSQVEVTQTATASSAVAASQAVTPTIESISSPSVDVETLSTSGITLTMWTTEVFSPLQNDLGSQLLKQQVTDFEAQESAVSVQFSLKKAYGKGGIYDYLQTTYAVVPERLPDVAIVDVTDVPNLASQGLLRPLNSLISEELRNDLFPFAQKSCTVDGNLFGFQFEPDVIHLVFNSELIKSPPLTWAQVLSTTMSYVFPESEDNSERVSHSFWLQYLALGDETTEEDNGPYLDRERLTEVFGFYRRGVENGIIPESVLDYRTEADAWAAYLSGKASMVDISSLRYLSSRSLLRDSGFAQIPTRDGRVFSLAKGWALVIVAEEPDRQQAAAQFVEWLLRPDHNGAWTRVTDRLPTTRQALAMWDKSDPYVMFCQDLLEQAKSYPTGSNFDLTAKGLQRNLRDVLAGTVSPDEAAGQAVGIVEK